MKENKNRLEDILVLFIILCPILDMASFIFRNIFHTNFSPSTVIRPIIPILMILYIFVKNNLKKQIISAGIIYVIYGAIHLFCFNIVKTGASYSNVIHEAQYIVNYTFMILNLFLYIYVFSKKDTFKLKKAILVSLIIYIASMYIAVFTNTSSHTYEETGIGYKGWFESGNSIGTILLLSIFIISNLIKSDKYKIIALVAIGITGIFTTIFLGTRVGLIGFFLVIAFYIISDIIINLLNKAKINKKLVSIGISTLIILLVIVVFVGSATIKRRKILNEESNELSEKANVQTHITGDMLDIKQEIDENTLDPEFMSEAQKKSVVDLYNIANKYNIKNNDRRIQQLIYNLCLVKNQANPLLILFGNGYLSNFYEMVLEMELVAFILNFGIIGFIIYCIPFIIILIYGIYKGIKNKKKVDLEYIMYLGGCSFVFILSCLSGYTFFNSSSMIIIIVLNTLLINKIHNFEEGK